VEDGGNVYKIGAFSATVKEPLWMIAPIFVVGVICIAGAVIGLLMLLPWLWFAVRGRLRERGGLFMRIAPLLASAALGVTMVIPIMAFSASGTSAVHQIADIGPTSIGVMIASVLLPLLALAGLVLAIRAAGARTIVRAYVIAHSLGLLAVSAYLASIGWFAVRTWTM